MTLTTIILLVLLVYFVQLFLQEISFYRFDMQAILGNRDSVPDKSVVADRLDCAKKNMQESLPIFLGLALLAIAREDDARAVTLGASIFLFARIAYVPAYVSGIPMLRSFVWLVAVVGLMTMAFSFI